MIICYHNIFVGIFKHQSSAAGLCGLPESGEVLEAPGVSVIHPCKDVLVVAAELEVLQLRLGRQLGAWGSIAYEEEGLWQSATPRPAPAHCSTLFTNVICLHYMSQLAHLPGICCAAWSAQ